MKRYFRGCANVGLHVGFAVAEGRAGITDVEALGRFISSQAS